MQEICKVNTLVTISKCGNNKGYRMYKRNGGQYKEYKRLNY